MGPIERTAEAGPVVIGVLDADRRVRAISGSVSDLLGFEASACAGVDPLEAVHPDDRPVLAVALGDPAGAGRAGRVDARLPRRSGGWRSASVVLAPLAAPEGGRLGFVITASRPPEVAGLESRVAELESRLRRIGAEVALAIPPGDSTRPPRYLAESGALSGRQRAVVERLLDGKRVLTIGNELGLSPSTVRNHLSLIFRKFGVRSQAELVEFLRGDGGV